MRRIFYFSLLLLFQFSCQQSEFEFSCDPLINEFVTENQAELSRITVGELTSYEIALQKAVFRSWGYEKKRNAWIEKLNHVLNENSFSQEESDHIKKLIGHIEVDYFQEQKIQSGSKTRMQFADNWIKYAIDELGWDDQFLAFLVYRLYTNQYQFDSEFYALKSTASEMTTNSESGTCNCNTTSDFCSGSACTSGGCSSSSGCGWLWSETCNGSC